MHRSEVYDDVRNRCGDGGSEAVPVTNVDLVELGRRGQPPPPATREVIDHGYPVAGRGQPLDQVAADEAGTAGDEDAPRHQPSPYPDRRAAQAQRRSSA